MQGTSSAVPALIGLGATVLGALLAALFALHRERLARREQAQVQALYDLQDSCLAYRQAWQDFEKVQAEQVPPEVLDAVVRAAQRLDIVETRIRCETVTARVTKWRSLAKLALLQDDKRPVSPDAEERAWLDIQEAAKRDLRRFS